jgi:hypothetical protein
MVLMRWVPDKPTWAVASGLVAMSFLPFLSFLIDFFVAI